MITWTRPMVLHDRCPAWGYGIHRIGAACWCEPTVEFHDVEDRSQLLPVTDRVMKVTHHPPVRHSGLHAHRWVDTIIEDTPENVEA